MNRIFNAASVFVALCWLSLPANAAVVVLDKTYYQESVSGQASGNPTRSDEGRDRFAPEAIGLEESGSYGAFRVNAWTAGWNGGMAYAHAEASGAGDYPGSFSQYAGNGYANASVSYQFVVEEIVPPCAIPPCDAIRVPVNIKGHGSVSVAASGGVPAPFTPAGYYAGANSTLYFLPGGGSWTALGMSCFKSADPFDPDCPGTDFAVDQTFDLRVNWANSIDLYVMAFANTGNKDAGWGIAEAWIDPIIEIDPGFALRENYRLVFSPGISFSAPPGGGSAPEPSTGLLLGTGLACLPFLMRSRKRG